MYLYNTNEYLICTLACYQDVTAPSCRQTAGWFKQIQYEPKRIMDLYAGCGLSTAHMAMSFPDAVVVYYNNRGKQWDVAEQVFERLGITNVAMLDPSDYTTHDCDVLLAFECLEHFRDPVHELKKFICPDVELYIDCSSFAYDGAGHFNDYWDASGQVVIPRKSMRRELNDWLRSIGYVDGHKYLGTKPFWQSRPQPWWRKLA